MNARSGGRDFTPPQPGEKYTDANGRELTVSYVVVGHRAGREVQGKIRYTEDDATREREYSTTMVGWLQVWVDKEPISTEGQGAADPV